MLKFISSAIIIWAFSSTYAVAQNVDCSVIKNNPASRERCEAGQRDARKYEREKEHHRAREERIRERLREGGEIVKKCRSYASCGWELVKPKKAE